jgi:hypothetical protein
MAYEVTNPIKLTSGGPGGSIRTWSYQDGDTWATVDAADYFLLEIGRLKVGDVIHGVCNGVAGTVKVVSNSGTAIDTSNAPANIDSD